MRLKIFILLFLIIFHTVANAEFIPVGVVLSSQVSPSGVEMELSSGAIARIDLLDPALARVRINFNGRLLPQTNLAISPQKMSAPLDSIFDTNGVIWLVTNKMTIAIVKSSFQLIALHPDGSLLSADLYPAVLFDADKGLTINRKFMPPDESIFGLGLNSGPINRHNRILVMRNTDQSGYDELTNPLYQSYPFYYGLHNGKAYGMFVSSPAYPFFDIGKSEFGVLTFGTSQDELDYYIIAGPDPKDVAWTYGRLTGFNPIPPKWSLGYHHSRYGWSSEREIKGIAAQLRDKDFPADTLWFDINYMNDFKKFSWDPVEFPQPIQMHQDLFAEGFRSIYIDEPCIRQDDTIWPFLDALGYFVKNGEGGSHLNAIWFGNVSWFDYSKDDASAWYKEQLKVFLSTGISGLWTDLNEPANNFMSDAIWDFNGEPRTETESRNLYALMVNKVAYEAQMELRPNVRPWNFSRSGYSGIQRYAHTWSGDAASTWSSLKAAI